MSISTTYNPEVVDQIIQEGGNVLYQSGNIIIASEISEELYSELSKSGYIETMESLPLKRYGSTEKTDVSTYTLKGRTTTLSNADAGLEDTSENQSGGGTNDGGGSSSSDGGGVI